MGIENLKGNIIDRSGNPIPNAKISIFRKIGEVLTDENGDYSNIEISDRNEYLIQSTKNEYYDNNITYVSDSTNLTLIKKDDFIEPPLPENIQIIELVENVYNEVEYNEGEVKYSILINWSMVNFDFIVGYNIYRGDEIQSVFERINDKLITENTYKDLQIELFKDYYYVLEVVSANNPINEGITSQIIGTSISQVIGPIKIVPKNDELIDITNIVKKIKVDSTKTNRNADKILNNDDSDDTWWESQNGSGAWIEIILNEKKYINGFYFRRPFLGIGILFATLQYWNYELNDWSNIQDLNFFIEQEYTFKNFIINTDRIRLYIKESEPLSEAQISKIIVYGE